MNDTPYHDLTPDLIMDAVESLGLRCNGQLLALNSYENRVYQIGIEDEAPVIGKFYRPGRWRDEAILEDHAFCQELAAREIPSVPPLEIQNRTLHAFGGHRFALYPRKGGRAPELDNAEVLEWIGRFLGRIHAVGAIKPFKHRGKIDIKTDGEDSVRFILQTSFVPDYLKLPLARISEEVLAQIKRVFADVGPARALRIHGDCHPGNILWTPSGPHFVDFDDCRTGPAVADVWMLLSGSRDEQERQLQHLLTGYQQFYRFDPTQLQLIEALRGLRILHYTAWLAKRWNDPAFPKAFPWFGNPRYWEEHVQTLQEQFAALQEPPLHWKEY
jgi:Ser/Thr protein kinase RdoA (MazF antagonist)